MIDGKEFDHTRVDRTMTLNGVQEWTLSSKNGSHPFHIHVNPFQVIKINGKPVDPVWRDTILVRSNPPVTVTMRTRYEVFTGKSLPRRGLAREWRRTLVLAGGYSLLVWGSLLLDLRPIYFLMLAAILIACLYAFFSWRAYRERERGIAQLRPFLTSQRLVE